MAQQVIVIGGGIVGQLVQHYVGTARVLDWRKTKPTGRGSRAYGATYLWQPMPGIPVTHTFPVITHIDGRKATEDSILAYKRKVGKAYELVRGGECEWQFREGGTGYDFAMPPTNVEYGMRVLSIDLAAHTVYVQGHGTIVYTHLVSCIPFYALMQLVGWTCPRLQWDPIYIKIMSRPPDSPFPHSTMYVNYLTSRAMPYRYTDRDSDRHFESLQPLPGKASFRLVPGKIHDHPETHVIQDMLRRDDVWCFGRYAEWQSDQLLHQTAQRILKWRDTILWKG